MAITIKRPAPQYNPESEFFGVLMQIRTVAHLTHLYQEDNNGWTHEAMEILYEKAPKIADKIIESWQGMHDKVKIKVPESTAMNALEYVANTYNYIEDHKEIFKESWIQNEIDNLCLLLVQTMFRLKYVK